MTISQEGRAAFEAFKAKRDGIEDRFQSELADRAGQLIDHPASKPLVADHKAAIAALTQTSTRLAGELLKARESFKASDRGKALAEAGADFASDRFKASGAGNPEKRDDSFGPLQDETFGPKSFAGRRPERGFGWQEKSRFGEQLGADRLRFSTALRAYERVEASTPSFRATFGQSAEGVDRLSR